MQFFPIQINDREVSEFLIRVAFKIWKKCFYITTCTHYVLLRKLLKYALKWLCKVANAFILE